MGNYNCLIDIRGKLMDYEDYLALSYTPLKAIEVLSDTIYDKCNEEWNMFSDENNRQNAENLLAINFAIKLCTKYLCDMRNKAVEFIV